MTGLRSGEVAAAAGVNVETLRYYERRGLLPEPRRTLGGHRLYSSDAVTLLRVIKAAQRLGFSLGEVAELIAVAGQNRRAAARHNGRAVAGLRTRAAAKLTEVEQKIADLQVIAETLRGAIDAGCDDLVACAGSPCCPLPFTELAENGASDR